jgi:cytochrome c oxidase cbb3-type subunit I/II
MSSTSPSHERFFYDDKIVRMFAVATVVWALVGMLVGVIIAAQLAYWPLNLSSWFTFGRLRPLHTNAVIFAFCGNAVFTGVYYSTQRLVKARMWSDLLSKIHFWGWQLIIVSAAITLPLGITVSKEYAELEWPIDIAIAIIWLTFAANFFMTLANRRERHLYVAIWFYIATIITITVLHVVNSLAIPVTLTKSYPVYAGVQDAFVQWWYGHNAVAFFLTTPFLGLMYYFLPKAAERPVYSYRLSILHFWSLVFIYIWAGPHHLHYTAIPDWLSTLGMVFSVMLLAPSWGGMINGLLTLRGAWHKVADDTVLKFFVVGITAYGMATFEGPALSIKSVNALSHYTDWTIGHVHSGALGWNGFITFGMLYWLVPRLWKRELYSTRLMSLHFWLGTVGIVLYTISMWVAGVTQGLMWKAFDQSGRLAHPDFIESVVQLLPMYWVRLVGGGMYFVGTALGAFSIFRTIFAADASIPDTESSAPPLLNRKEASGSTWHRRLEGLPLAFSVWTAGAVIVASLFEFVPAFLIERNVPSIDTVKPYTALELEGRDLYVRDGCYTCHSQMVRPFRSETERYGPYSRAGEFIYDRPFQWGSKRTGPDLHRVGGKYPDLWHLRHMEDPRSTSPGSIMPDYAYMLEDDLDLSATSRKLSALAWLGTPYSKEEIDNAVSHAKAQASEISQRLRESGETRDVEGKEIIAMIAYLQRLGTDFKESGTEK